jgi:hypothetical protein
LIFPLIKLLIVLGSEVIHFFIELISVGFSILDFLIVLDFDILNGSDFSDDAFLLLALLLQFGDLIFQWLKLFIISVDFLSQNLELIIQDGDFIIVLADLGLDFDVGSALS